jgi:hypothetical protein
METKQKLKELKKECPGDFVFVVSRFGEVVFISKPFTHYEEALSLYKSYLNVSEDLNDKLQIKQLLQRSA